MQNSQDIPDSAAFEWMLPRDAASTLGVTTTTLAAWAEAGVVESMRLPSGHRRYLTSSVRALHTKMRTEATA